MNVALIFAGGAGKRMNTKELPKQFLTLHGKPIIIYTLELFEEHPEVDGIVVVCLAGWIEYLQSQINKYRITKVKSIVSGGSTGQESICKGIVAINELYSGDDTVLVHDGVRPLISKELISENIRSVREYGNAISSAEVAETIMLNSDEHGCVESIADRDTCRFAKAPQSFRVEDLLNAHMRAVKEGKTDFTDSACLMQYYGATLHLVKSNANNIKITTPTDYYLFRAIIESEENKQFGGY